MESSKRIGLVEFFVDAGRLGVASETAGITFFLLALVEHARDKTVPFYLFACLSVPLFWVGGFLAWHKKHKALARLEIEKEFPRLYLFYDANFGGASVFHYTGLFLRTEDERVASCIRISSPETVGVFHSRLRIRWTDPGQNVGKNPFPVQLRCVTVKDERESCINQVDGDQLGHYFKGKKDEPMELIVTLEYTDMAGNQCPIRKFKIYKDPKTLVLMPDRIICEPIKD
jgi:hypothetical protein